VASLIDDLVTTLEMEITEYTKLLELSKKKTPVIIKGDMEQLRKITDDEQIVADNIVNLDSKRMAVTKDIAGVLNTDVETLKLSVLINVLERRPVEQQRVADVRDRLKAVVDSVKMINDNNRELIKHSLEMIEFDMNLLKAMRQAPETNNYGRGALNSGSILGGTVGGFDAKQ